MEELSKTRLDKMGRLHNAIVDQVDRAALAAPDVIAVLTLITHRLEAVMLAKQNAPAKKE